MARARKARPREAAISSGTRKRRSFALVTSTTVKGRPDYDRYLVNPPRLIGPVNGPSPSAKRTHPPAKTPAAGSGDDGLTAA